MDLPQSGLHPNLQVSPQLIQGCIPFVVLDLPAEFFVDVYQLRSLGIYVVSEFNQDTNRFNDDIIMDLEAPAWVSSESKVVLAGDFNGQVPLHTRYIPISGIVDNSVGSKNENNIKESDPYGWVYLTARQVYQCENIQNGMPMVHDSILGEVYAESPHTFAYCIPTARMQDTPYVALGTLFVVLFGFIAIVFRSIPATKRKSL